jgi:PIN domain nuclease of toxin-antitoxin system
VTAILVDTHIALWALGDTRQLTPRERELLTDVSLRRCLSPMSVWEASIKRQAGRLRAPRALATVLAAEFTMLTVDPELLEASAELPRHHGDPFDRVLVAHAIRDDLEVLTRDSVFGAYGVRLAR